MVEFALEALQGALTIGVGIAIGVYIDRSVQRQKRRARRRGLPVDVSGMRCAFNHATLTVGDQHFDGGECDTPNGRVRAMLEVSVAGDSMKLVPVCLDHLDVGTRYTGAWSNHAAAEAARRIRETRDA